MSPSMSLPSLEGFTCWFFALCQTSGAPEVSGGRRQPELPFWELCIYFIGGISLTLPDSLIGMVTPCASAFLKGIEENISANYLFSLRAEMNFAWYFGRNISISTTESLVANRLTLFFSTVAPSADIWYRNQVKQYKGLFPTTIPKGFIVKGRGFDDWVACMSQGRKDK